MWTGLWTHTEENMGVTYGKKKDLPGGSETRENGSVLLENQNEEKTQWPELLASPSQPQSEEETTDLITLQKPLNPFTAPQSRQELHKELQMTNKRRPSQERKSELQQALEKRKWEQRMETGRDQEEAKKNHHHFIGSCWKEWREKEKATRERSQSSSESKRE
ncbi:hypothetical protein Q5P01_001564 [Channa striata]|uniref:Uncharacterized protein n=1 Tax=Channa striata TaxID=64152 RepID=A0AA88NR61_CHASR|nr:hypothetical protein Q5P01_001564 [Channa striata]